MLPSIWRNTDLSRTPVWDNVLDSFFGGGPVYSGERAWAPRVDINETDDDITIEADLPGVNKEDIKVDVRNGVLTLTGERKDEHEETKKGYRSVERHYGAFSRSFTVPETVDVNNIKAAYKDGVMKLTLPKTEEAKPKEVSIEVK